MALHARRVVPVRIRRRDPELGCDVLSIVGYRAVCSCGWRGSTSSTAAEARRERCPSAGGPSSAA